MELHQIFGRNVQRARKAAGYSQEEFADLTGLARSYMSDVERGARNPTLRIVERIAKGLGTPPQHLLNDEAAFSPVNGSEP
jgi:transcriptional regulator with XRE-family HTH domain